MLRRVFQRKLSQDGFKVQARNRPVRVQHHNPILHRLLLPFTIRLFPLHLFSKHVLAKFGNLAGSLIPRLRKQRGQHCALGLLSLALCRNQPSLSLTYPTADITQRSQDA